MKVMYVPILIALLGIGGYAAEFPICTKPGNQKHPDVVFDGTKYTVVYDSVGRIYGAKISTNGTVLSKFLIPGGTGQDTTPSIAFDGTNFFVVWYRSNLASVYGVVVDQSNNVIVGPFLIPMNGHFHPVITFMNNYNKFLITASYFVLLPMTGVGVLEGITYNTNYTVDHPYFVIFSTPSNYGDLGNVGHSAISADGSRFIVIYPYGYSPDPNVSWQNTLDFKFVTPTGQVQPGGTIRTMSGAAAPHETLLCYPADVAFNGTKYFAAYHFAESGYMSDGRYNNVYGRIINTDGTMGSEISIATQSNMNEFAAAVTAEDNDFFVVWQDYRTGSSYNLFGRHYDQSGVASGNEVMVCNASYNQILPQVAFDGHNNLVVWQDYRSGTNWDIYGSLLPKWLTTNDPLALAYNGNRHLVRNPSTRDFHLICTDRGKVVYRYSSNDGVDWPTLFIVGDGKLPSITLNANGYAYVAWTDDAGGLWFRYQTGSTTWSSIYHLYTPGPGTPYLNSPPSIALVVNRGVIYPHILVTRTGRIAGNGVAHLVEDFNFPVTNPSSGTFELLEYRDAPAEPPCRSFPSIVKDDFDSLHAVWQRGDTIAYATRYRVSSWQVWGAPFDVDGRQSAHPFVETYGNNVYIAWQKGPSPEEAWRAYRTFHSATWTKNNMSLTSTTKSLYAVNAWGYFTVFADEYNSPWDVYYKTVPADPLYNISQTAGVISQYPHSVAKFDPTVNHVYTAWLEGNATPCEIRFKKISHSIPLAFAYLSSLNGHNPASPYLAQRDGYMADWQIPVDYGYSTITYRFPILPGFKYKLNVIAYHEGSGEWREWVSIDGAVQHLAKYNAYQPDTTEFMIPPAFYQDSMIEVVFERIEGDFATAGPIEIYRYEYEEGEGGGPMSQSTSSVNDGFISTVPNPFGNVLTIRCQKTNASQAVSLKVYDITGRLVQNLYRGIINGNSTITWYGKDDEGRIVPTGIYFIRIEDFDAGEVGVQKVLKVK